jgi:hypothetical protein
MIMANDVFDLKPFISRKDAKAQRLFNRIYFFASWPPVAKAMARQAPWVSDDLKIDRSGL